MTQNDQAGEDLRVKRTRKLILAALIELTIQKGFSAVTVSDITKSAGVNRATFYRHYQDKFDLLNQYAETVHELLDAPPQGRPGNPEDGSGLSKAPGLVTIFEHIRANAEFYRVMLGHNGDPAFAGTIRQYVQKRIWRSLPAGLQLDETSLDLYLSASSSASVGAVLWWLEHDLLYPPEEMAIISYQLGVAILSSMSGRGSAGRPTPHGRGRRWKGADRERG